MAVCLASCSTCALAVSCSRGSSAVTILVFTVSATSSRNGFSPTENTVPTPSKLVSRLTSSMLCGLPAMMRPSCRFVCSHQSSMPGGATCKGVLIMHLVMFSLSPSASPALLRFLPHHKETASARSSRKLKHPVTGFPIPATRCAWTIAFCSSPSGNVAANATGENGSPRSSPAYILNSIVSPFSFLEIALVGWVSCCASNASKCGILLWSACRHFSLDSSPNAFVQLQPCQVAPRLHWGRVLPRLLHATASHSLSLICAVAIRLANLPGASTAAQSASSGL